MRWPVTTLQEKFEQKVERIPFSNCWIWKAWINEHGYGRMRVKNNLVLAHRVSWEIHKTSIPKGLCVLHHCDVPSCVNPDHLFLGTQKDNILDMFKKGRGNIIGRPKLSHCRKGHALDDSNIYMRFRNGRIDRQCKQCTKDAARRRKS